MTLPADIIARLTALDPQAASQHVENIECEIEGMSEAESADFIERYTSAVEVESERARDEAETETAEKAHRAEREEWIDGVAARLTAEAEALGCTVERKSSGLSEAVYLEIDIYGRDEAGDEDYAGTLKIRIADHDPKPTYERLNGSADLHIGDHQTAYIEGVGQDADAASAWLRAKIEAAL